MCLVGTRMHPNLFFRWKFYFLCVRLIVKFFIKKLFLQIWRIWVVFIFRWFKLKNENSSFLIFFHPNFFIELNKYRIFLFQSNKCWWKIILKKKPNIKKRKKKITKIYFSRFYVQANTLLANRFENMVENDIFNN